MNSEAKSQERFTPGPWTIDMRDWRGRPAQDLYISGGEYSNAAGELCRTGLAIVTCPETGSAVGHANAHLIAAAPDCYDALRDVGCAFSDIEIEKLGIGPLIEKVRAALALTQGPAA